MKPELKSSVTREETGTAQKPGPVGCAAASTDNWTSHHSCFRWPAPKHVAWGFDTWRSFAPARQDRIAQEIIKPGKLLIWRFWKHSPCIVSGFQGFRVSCSNFDFCSQTLAPSRFLAEASARYPTEPVALPSTPPSASERAAPPPCITGTACDQ